jgi:hypothetical protein
MCRQLPSQGEFDAPLKATKVSASTDCENLPDPAAWDVDQPHRQDVEIGIQENSPNHSTNPESIHRIDRTGTQSAFREIRHEDSEARDPDTLSGSLENSPFAAMGRISQTRTTALEEKASFLIAETIKGGQIVSISILIEDWQGAGGHVSPHSTLDEGPRKTALKRYFTPLKA